MFINQHEPILAEPIATSGQSFISTAITLPCLTTRSTDCCRRRPLPGALSCMLILMAFSTSIFAQSAAGLREFSSISKNQQGEAEGLFKIYRSPAALQNTSLQPAVPSRATSTGEYNDQAVAEQFLMQHKLTLGIASSNQLRFLRMTSDMAGGRHVRFARTYRGMGLYGMEVIVHFDNRQRVTGMNGNIVRLSQDLKTTVDAHLLNGSPVLNAELALAAVAANEGLSPTQLIVQSNQAVIIQQSPFVVWEIICILPQRVPYKYRVSDNMPPVILSKEDRIVF